MEFTQLILGLEDTPAGRLLGGGFRRLRFSDARLEREFCRVLRRQRIGVLTMALAAAMLATLLFGWLEWQLLPRETALLTAAIRTGLMLLLPAAALVAAHTHRLRARLGAFAILALAGLGAGSIATDAIVQGYSGTGSHPALALVVMFGYLFLGLRLVQSLALNGLMSLAQLLVLGLGGITTGRDLLDSTLFLALANLLGAGGGYLLEHGWRTDYLKTLVINQLAERDGLTGVYNRRMFDHYIERIWRESIRDKALLVMMLVDIDCFREFNDSYGLRAGDEALRNVAGAITRSARRPLDFVARYTGLRFAIILFNPDRAYAEELPQRLRSHVAALAIPHADSPVADRLTVSIGVALTVPSERQTLQGFVGLAETALTEAKARGRDCIVAAESQDTLAQTGMFDAELIAPSGSGGR